MPTISGVIITCDERNYFLKECIDAALQVCDEIIVCDTSPEAPLDAVAVDNWYEGDARVKIIYRRWRGPQSYTRIRNWANQFAKSEWIFSLDADEILGDNAYEIRDFVEQISKQDPEVEAFSLRGVHYIYTFVHVDDSVPEHIWLGRVFRNNGLIKYDEEKGMHGLPIGQGKVATINTPDPIIHHLGYLKDQARKILKQYDNNIKYKEIHTTEFLKMWAMAHLGGKYPVKVYTGPYPSILPIGRILNAQVQMTEADKLEKEKLKDGAIKDNTN